MNISKQIIIRSNTVTISVVLVVKIAIIAQQPASNDNPQVASNRRRKIFQVSAEILIHTLIEAI